MRKKRVRINNNFEEKKFLLNFYKFAYFNAKF